MKKFKINFNQDRLRNRTVLQIQMTCRWIWIEISISFIDY